MNFWMDKSIRLMLLKECLLFLRPRELTFQRQLKLLVLKFFFSRPIFLVVCKARVVVYQELSVCRFTNICELKVSVSFFYPPRNIISTLKGLNGHRPDPEGVYKIPCDCGKVYIG